MGTFRIEGGHQLHGEITPQGAKNEALQILCAVLLTSEKVSITNIPDIVDVNKLISLLEDLGVKIQKKGQGSYTFMADDINLEYLQSAQFKEDGRGLRGSIMLVGPLLARFGKGYIPKPGGDKIGRRRLDTHFEGFIKLGAKFRYNKEEHFYGVEAKKLKGTYMLLDEASVTGTANIVMASVLADGKTTIYNAACEPYLQQLCKMLNRMGAKIILVMATQAKGEVLIHQKMFESRLFFVDKLIDMGAKIILCDPHRATVIGHNFKSSLKATTMVSPDIRAGVSLLIAALSAKGTSTIHNIEQIDRGYENIDTRLRAIGAKITRV